MLNTWHRNYWYISDTCAGTGSYEYHTLQFVHCGMLSENKSDNEGRWHAISNGNRTAVELYRYSLHRIILQILYLLF